MVTDREINDGNISLMVEERKELEVHVSHQRKVLAEKKKAMKKNLSEKKIIYQYQQK